MARVAGLALAPGHGFAKRPVDRLRLVAGEGVEGDAHRGATVKHRSRVRVDPSQPNLRQIHLISVELLADYATAGFPVAPGALGENLLTEGIDLHALPRGARLAIGAEAEIGITGLRNPCDQIEAFMPGLLAHVLKREGGRLVRRAGIMAVVLRGGEIARGDRVRITPPDGAFEALERV